MAKYPFGNNLNVGIFGNPFNNKNKRVAPTFSQKKAILMEQKNKCAECNKYLTGSIQFDHIQEHNKKGLTTTSNLRALCGTCHDKRHLRDKAKQIDEKRIKESKKRNNPSYNLLSENMGKSNNLWKL